jgi:UDP-glucose 4-epimerase
MGVDKKNIAVLGVNGYIGRHLADRLRQSGHSVLGCDLQPAAALSGLPYLPLDVTTPAAWDALDTALDAIFVFSGLTGTHRGFEDYARYVAVNELGLLHLLDLLRRRGHRPRLVFPSTRLVYRGRPAALEEDAPKESKTVYAANKLAAEGFLQAYQAAFGIPYTVFRICVPYGSRWNGSYSFGTTGAFIRMAREQKAITLFGDGSPRRTFTHVQDLCAQIEACGLRPETNGETYNTAGEPFSLRDVATWIAARFGAEVRYAPWPAHEAAIESGDTVFADAKILALSPPPRRFHLRDWIATTDFTS